MDNPCSIIGNEILDMNCSVPPEKPASIIVDNPTDMNHTDEIVASGDSPDGMRQNRDIIKEVASINQQARDKYSYKKTIDWHQQSVDTQALDQADQLGQIIQHLDRIEEKLDSLEKMLKS